MRQEDDDVMRNTTRITNRPRRRAARAVAVGLTATLATALLGACSSDDDGGGGDDENITLRVGVFGQFGYQEAGLYDEYMEANPNITIEQDSTTENADYIAQLRTRLGQNSGLADIQAIEVGNIAEMTSELSPRWVDFNEYDVDTSHFVPWKVDQATDADGRVIGLGTDIGPTGICYRTDYFEQAGLPTESEAVSELFAGGWEDYIAVGEDFAANAPDDVAYLDSAGGMFNAVVSAFEERYTNEAGEVIYQESEGVQTAWDLSLQVADAGLTDQQQQFSPEWERALANGAFATLPACPAWMLTTIQSHAGDAGAGLWSMARSPEPSNWGGSFIGVTDASEHKEEAVALAEWLTAPEQQAKIFANAGNFPSSATAQETEDVQNATNEYFPGVQIGQILSTAAAEIPSTPIGPNDQIIQESITNGLVTVEQQGNDPDSAWEDVVSALDNALAE
ncbi:ABC transporter substrate-binding protein [Streptomyces johnsoniae]|uniref:ABC transporter substrate-binding protein n=1 Tax=Streptomyces johnsoniae TaxID=3075532 RepID=A0ABU2S3C4_9ACTN|nr:ABC transporter substrate-binding protein [Streptomyces sp. DSM 41886]MDT0443298.1 ABC transporter substrate-binding protein [Streptomyces sp. DSM 41886]